MILRAYTTSRAKKGCSCSSSCSFSLSFPSCCSAGGGGGGGASGSGGDVVKQFAESSGVPVGKVVNFLTNGHFKKKQKQSDINKKTAFFTHALFFNNCNLHIPSSLRLL